MVYYSAMKMLSIVECGTRPIMTNTFALPHLWKLKTWSCRNTEYNRGHRGYGVDKIK